jgi:hypothetical protein
LGELEHAIQVRIEDGIDTVAVIAALRRETGIAESDQVEVSNGETMIVASDKYGGYIVECDLSTGSEEPNVSERPRRLPLSGVQCGISLPPIKDAQVAGQRILPQLIELLRQCWVVSIRKESVNRHCGGVRLVRTGYRHRRAL